MRNYRLPPTNCYSKAILEEGMRGQDAPATYPITYLYCRCRDENGNFRGRRHRGRGRGAEVVPARRCVMSSGQPREVARSAYWKTAGNLLGRLRDRHGWSYQELADRAGVTADLVVAYELARVR